MGQVPEITGLAAWIVLMLPLAILALLMVLALRGPRPGGKRVSASQSLGPTFRPATEASSPLPRNVDAPSGRAEAGTGDEQLVHRHLASARQEIEAGRQAEAAARLRSAIRLATRLGMREAHAEARLELAEISRVEGDLTTACEHWQIARAIFADLKQTRELKQAEALMRAHGCPTDWVLTDF